MGDAAGDIDLAVSVYGTIGFEIPDKGASVAKQLHPGASPLTMSAEDFVHHPAAKR